MQIVKNSAFLALAFCVSASVLLIAITRSAEAGSGVSGSYSEGGNTGYADTLGGPGLPESLRSGIPGRQGRQMSLHNDSDPGEVKPATRIKVGISEKLDISIPSEAVEAAVVVSPEIASVQIKSGSVVTIFGLRIGETILIISDRNRRFVFVVEVAYKPAEPKRVSAVPITREQTEKPRTTGIVNFSYSAGLAQTSSYLKQRFELRREMSDESTLRASGEIFKAFRGDERTGYLHSAQSFGLNRLSFGIDSSSRSIDFLDSELHVTPLSSNGLAMRGFHLISNQDQFSNSRKSNKKGFEIFAGIARPSHSLFDDRNGKLAGVTVPIAGGKSWQARAGLVSISPGGDGRFGPGGRIASISATYEPNDRLSTGLELSYSNGKVSWRSKVNLRLPHFRAFGEITRVDPSSPLNSIGAQQAATKTEAAALDWRPDQRFIFSVSYTGVENRRLTSFGSASSHRLAFSINGSYRLRKSLQFTLRFREQKIEVRRSESAASNYTIETRTASFANTVRLRRNFSNMFEVQLSSSREATAGSHLENGFNLIERLSYSRGETSATVFATYAHNTSSLAGVIVRNPYFLAPALQKEILLDPVRFLRVYGDRLSFLLPGIELPLTRSLNTGFRLQTAVSRFTISGEMRYDGGSVPLRSHRNLSTSVGVNIRLDAANAFRIDSTHALGSGGRSSVTFSYTHQFGSRDGGFQFSKLFGRRAALVEGRVYHDLNGNGQEDPNEAGLAGIKVNLTDASGTTTNSAGAFRLSTRGGFAELSLGSDDLGVRLRPTTPLPSTLKLVAGQSVAVNLGLTDVGSLGGRIVIGVGKPGDPVASHLKGLGGVRMIIRGTTGRTFNASTSIDGSYEVRNLRPGNYTLEIDPASLPANFRLPEQTAWTIRVDPLTSAYFDVPLDAYRAVAGIVFVDRNGNGRFNAGTDVPVEGATIMSDGSVVAISGANGEYIVRNLKAGKISLTVRSPNGGYNEPTVLEFDAAPETKKINYAIKP